MCDQQRLIPACVYTQSDHEFYSVDHDQKSPDLDLQRGIFFEGESGLKEKRIDPCSAGQGEQNMCFKDSLSHIKCSKGEYRTSGRCTGWFMLSKVASIKI